MNIILLVEKIPAIMEKKSITMQTDIKHTALGIQSEGRRRYLDDVKKSLLNKINLLECVLKELAFFKTKNEKLLKDCITSIINNFFNGEVSLIRVREFIRETNNFSIPSTIYPDLYKDMDSFEKELNEIINTFANKLYFEVKYTCLKNDTTIIDMPVMEIEHESSEASVR